MKRIYLYSNLFWLLFTLFVCIEAYRMHLGTINDPGPGFFPFCVGLVMLGLSLAALIQSASKTENGQKTLGWKPVRWWNIVIILTAIVVYAVTLETVGFVINTFLFVGLLLKVVEPQPWKVAFLGGLIATIAANLVFNVIFRSQIPSGIFGF